MHLPPAWLMLPAVDPHGRETIGLPVAHGLTTIVMILHKAGDKVVGLAVALAGKDIPERIAVMIQERNALGSPA